MHHDGSFVASRGPATPAAVAIPLEYLLPQPAKVPGILSPERVAGRTVAVRNDLLPAATAVKCSLTSLLHLRRIKESSG